MLFSTLLRREPFNWLIISPLSSVLWEDYINQASKRSRDSQERIHKEQKVYAAAILPPSPQDMQRNCRGPNPPLARPQSSCWAKTPTNEHLLLSPQENPSECPHPATSSSCEFAGEGSLGSPPLPAAPVAGGGSQAASLPKGVCA